MTENSWTTVERVSVADYEELKPGEYVQINRKFLHPDLYAVMRCNCSKLCSLPRKSYSIDWRGAVSPRTRCSGCKQSMWLWFLNWRPESKGTA